MNETEGAVTGQPTGDAVDEDEQAALIEAAPAQSAAMPPWRQRVGRGVRVMAMALFGFALLAVALLLVFQRWLLYHPRPYEAAVLRPELLAALPIEFSTAQGLQRAFYLPPAEAPGSPWQPPRRLWVLFHGNASLALDWLDLLEPRPPDPQAGYLLVDYPGYGACAGSPTRTGVIENGQAALAAVLRRCGGTSATVELNLLGYSIGSAAALELAVQSAPRRVILIAPFTTMLGMARRTVGWPLCGLLRDCYDSEARLHELATHQPPPRLTIIHGSDDQLVPPAMGRTLAEQWPGGAAYHEIRGAEHGSIIEMGWPRVRAAMLAPLD